MKIAGIIMIVFDALAWIGGYMKTGIPPMGLIYILLLLGGIALIANSGKGKQRIQNHPNVKTLTMQNEKPHTVRQASRFCKRCGSQIDPETKKCTGCGKQYPYFNEKLFWRVFTPVICIVLAVVIILQYNNNQLWINAYNEQLDKLDDLQKTIDIQVDKISELKEDVDSKSSIIYSYQGQVEALQAKANALDWYAVFIGKGSNIYHKYDCSHLITGGGLLVFNSENAKAQGYKPCPYCCK